MVARDPGRANEFYGVAAGLDSAGAASIFVALIR